jgi:hypothetical protein
METKLTLRLGDYLIAQAKKQAKKNGKSISKMVADYFRSLTGRGKPSGREMVLTPLVAALRGSLKGSKVGIPSYRRHLEEKYL